ncbi:DNA-directed RNA polymerase subunit B [Candidatus Bathyarchaeota archaeon]|nr:MAG: DNA-directed RNA polymerase subunit B [Candidatus Bathyarchaeota archaeon]
MAVTQTQLWNLAKEFIHDSGLVRQHIDSYNDFVERGLQAIVDEVAELPIDIGDYPLRIRLGKIEIGAPRVIEVDGTERSIYPAEARIRNLTYAAPLHMEMIPVIGEREGQPEMVYIGDLPVMLKSRICLLSKLGPDELIGVGEDPIDPGGYFIVNGSERVIVALEDLAANRILVDVEHTGVNPTYKAKIFSTTVGFRARIECALKGDGGVYVTMPGIPSDIPFMILMRALGFEEDAKIAELVSTAPHVQDELEASYEKSLEATNARDAMLYLGNRLAPGQVDEYRLKKAESVLDRNFLPHLGRLHSDRKEKALFLAEIATRIIEVKQGKRSSDDKDHYANKRLKLAGSLLAELFRISFRNLTRDLKYQLERITIRRHIEFSIANAIRPGIITERVQHAIATGNWVRGRIGVTQLLDRTNFISTLSHLRRLQSPLSRSQPNLEARDLHPTHYGRLCPDETPEGSNCGLVKNLALSSSISVGIEPREMVDRLRRMGVVPVDEADKKLRTTGGKVLVDGFLSGYAKDPVGLAAELREYRREGKVSSEVNFAYQPPETDDGRSELHVNCDAGRVRRPLILVENGRPRLTEEHLLQLEQGRITWQDLVRSGIVELLDADEEENTLVAMYEHELGKEHTHLEITPYTMLGIAASLIPFPEHNQSPRNAYESAMAKQALGVFSTNYFNRCDSRSHLLHYAQTPIVQTKPMEVFNFLERPSGQNVVVAILSFQGYNMEDAIIINKSSVDRGLFRSTFYRIYEAESRQYLGGLRDKFEIPEAGIRGYRGDRYYRLIEEDGIISPEAEVSGNTVLVGRTSPPRFLEEYREFEVKGPTKRDSSVTMRPSEEGTIDQVFVTESIEGSRLVKVKVRDLRIPELGDKFASRHGQKGVIGLLVPQEDMPFTVDGVVPDVIINPHAIPSRMTIGQFVETLGGKVASQMGEIVDGTAFENIGPSALGDVLEKLGFEKSGRESLYNGITGEKLAADLFIGVVYYQKLHQTVADKMHARARGQVQMLTRQPTEGRARGGGLRFGEMERDCLIGHGASALLRDRLLEESDKYTAFVCETCGTLAYHDIKQNKYICKIDAEKAVVSPVSISYAFKLLVQELMALGIAPRLNLEERA